jgi:hypothetical protein
MIFFIVGKKIRVEIQSNSVTLLSPPAGRDSKSTPLNRIYCCTSSEFIQIGRALELRGLKNLLQLIPESQIKSRSDFPKQLGVSNAGEWERTLYFSGILKTIDEHIVNPEEVDLGAQISSLHGKRIRIAVFNGLGSGIGDTVVGLTALSQVHELIADVAKPIFEVIYSHEQYARLARIQQHTKLIDKVHTSPMTLKQLIGFDAIFDTGGMGHRRDFDEMPTTDFFLKSFGLKPERIPARQKRNKLIQLEPGSSLRQSIEKIRYDNPDKKLVLFHPKASTELRSVPEKHLEKIIQELGSMADSTLVAVVPVPGNNLPLNNISSQCQSFKDLCFVISQMDGIITVDTSIYHIADCFSIPTVVWFTSINPDLRVRYYPAVSGILLDGARQSGLYNKHILREGDNLKEVEELWKNFDPGRSLTELEELRKRIANG